MSNNTETIAAIATPPGRGGIGVIRVSGPGVKQIACALLGKLPEPRYAAYTSFFDKDQQIIDQGIAILYAAPHSFTGEDVLELQGHGGPIILDAVLQQVMQHGARLARPGEFSERAFLNKKLDLVQAEAIADLIDAASTQAARAAVRSLQGEFSQRIQSLVTALIQLRSYIEAAIDFSEEEVDFLSEYDIASALSDLQNQLSKIQQGAKQGVLLREGINVVIAGEPNAGKSSLLNALSGRDTAIVTPIAGTTRDVIREFIHIDGIPLHIFDTAGLRDSADEVEREGIRRALQAISEADQILLVLAGDTIKELDAEKICQDFFSELDVKSRLTIILNKIDLIEKMPEWINPNNIPLLALSAKNHAGLPALRQHLKQCMGFSSDTEGDFSARRRHLQALTLAQSAIEDAQLQLNNQRAGELLAEDLRQAQQALSSITGEFSADDLLGTIFSSFCIGK